MSCHAKWLARLPDGMYVSYDILYSMSYVLYRHVVIWFQTALVLELHPFQNN